MPLAMFWTTLRISLDVLKVEMFVKCAVPKVLSCWFYSSCHLIKVVSWRHTSKFLPSRIHFSAGVFSKNWVTKLMNKKVLMEFLAHINIQRFNCLWKQLGQQVAKWQKYKNTICFFFLLLESTFYILCLKKWVTKLMP